MNKNLRTYGLVVLATVALAGVNLIASRESSDEITRKGSSSSCSTCPKQSCPTCPTTSCPSCPKQSSPSCPKQSCPSCHKDIEEEMTKALCELEEALGELETE